MRIVGIDNGINGALASIELDGTGAIILPMPTLPHGKSGRILDATRLRRFLVAWGEADGQRVYIEEATYHPPRGRDGKPLRNTKTGEIITALKGGTHLIRDYGIALGMMAGLQIPCTPVRPTVWQRVMLAGMPRLGGAARKASSIERAQQLFPDVSLLRTPRCKKPSHDIADALLIAEYGRRLEVGGANVR